MNTGYCDYFPKDKEATVLDAAEWEMWQIFNVKKGSWYFWYAIILDEVGKLNLYPGTKYHGYTGVNWRATIAQQHRLIKLLFGRELLFEP